MVKKKKVKIKDTDYSSPKLKYKKRIWSIRAALMLSLFVIILVIILLTFAASMDVLRSAQANEQRKFYYNTVNTTAKGVEESLKLHEINTIDEFEKRLPHILNYMNSRLMQEYRIKDIFITEKSDDKNSQKLIYTTVKNPDKDSFDFKPQSLIPVEIIFSHDFKSDGYIMQDFQINYNDKFNNTKTYCIYISIPKIDSKYKLALAFQLAWFFIVLIVICMSIMYILVRSITNPLNQMEKTVSRIAKGDLSGRLEFTGYDEINKLVAAYNMMANALQRLYSSLENQVQDRTKELQSAYAELKSTQAMMVHSEKMKSLGELVAGIMHEINNPINFIYGNMTHLGNYSKDLISIIDKYTEFDLSLKDYEKTEIDSLKEECDYEFLKTDMPDLIKSCKEGAERAKNIIQDLKSFSRMEEVSIKDVDVPHEIDSVLNILHNKIKNKAVVHKEYSSDIPKVEAFGGQLNQVFMNILDNAVGAIENTGDIWIRINTNQNNMIIEIEDNGSGMDEKTINSVFDPFFTTKPVGQGTGLGMSITYKIIKNHQGNIDVVSKKGKGTKFIITLPLNIDRENLKAPTVKQEGKKQNG